MDKIQKVSPETKTAAEQPKTNCVILYKNNNKNNISSLMSFVQAKKSVCTASKPIVQCGRWRARKKNNKTNNKKTSFQSPRESTQLNNRIEREKHFWRNEI
jgi:hypothetical protein